MRRWVGPLVGIGTVLALVVVVLALRGCPKPTSIERHADSVLATVPVWRDSVRARDSMLALRARDAVRLRRNLAVAEDSARARLARADQLQARADTVAVLPSGIAPHDSITRLTVALEGQKRAAVELRTVVVPALQAAVAQARVSLAQADATIRIQSRDLEDAYRRVDSVTVALDRLRQETRHKGDWNLPLGVHLPRWTRDAVLMVGAGYAGYRIGKQL